MVLGIGVFRVTRVLGYRGLRSQGFNRLLSYRLEVALLGILENKAYLDNSCP